MIPSNIAKIGISTPELESIHIPAIRFADLLSNTWYSLTITYPNGGVTCFHVSATMPEPEGQCISRHNSDLMWALCAAGVAAKRPCPPTAEGYEWLGSYHPLIIHTLLSYGSPADYHLLALENPAPSLDGQRLAYWRNDAKRAEGVRTATAPGKYLARHWPNIPSHQIADLVRLHFPPALALVWCDTTESMLHAVQRGPDSCMRWDEDDLGEGESHPYEAYAPRLGWRLATLQSSAGIMSRALVHEPSKTFVRTFKKVGDNNTCACENLQSQLQALGYIKEDGWYGLELAKVPVKNGQSNAGGCVLPYIDGTAQYVYDSGDTWTITDDEGDAEWKATSTDGSASVVDQHFCEDCGDRMGPDDGAYIDTHGTVCDCCLQSNYIYAWVSRRGREYVRDGDENIYEYDGEYYTLDALDAHNLVALHDGTVCPLDDAVGVDGDMYHIDDTVYSEAQNEYILMREAFCCDHDGDWHHINDLSEVVHEGTGYRIAECNFDAWLEDVTAISAAKAAKKAA